VIQQGFSTKPTSPLKTGSPEVSQSGQAQPREDHLPDTPVGDNYLRTAETELPAPTAALSIKEESATPSALSGVLTARATPPPTLSAPVSQGISGGRLLSRIAPVYPDQAQMQRIQGRVVVEAMVMEDGSVGGLKVVQGPDVLAQSAMEAVKHWRYQPFVLDGKPIQRETTITIDFKLAPKTH
jgi:TonB family protein